MLVNTVVSFDNPWFELAHKFVFQTSRSVFLTGKAGTGKTTFLKHIKEHCQKKLVVLAPTGVAAIHAGGVTIHSFFHLPFKPFLPVGRTRSEGMSDSISLLKNLKFDSEKREIIKELELLIIDEVSMVRVDVLDAIDTILRYVRKRRFDPFGGVQLLFIGDPFQLPPVVSNTDWSLLSSYYSSEFFFDAYVFKEAKPVFIELQKIYRQRQESFIEVLNNVRANRVTTKDIEILNDRYRLSLSLESTMSYITLTSHNAKADVINDRMLTSIPQDPISFEAVIEGDFPERFFPTEKSLLLKAGAQVMFIKNDVGKSRRYYNGKVGTIDRFDDEKIIVQFQDGQPEVEVERHKWNNVRYTYNGDTHEIEEEVIGSFSQYPIRLAWAVTVHKSQGLTFEKVILDIAEAFAPGQVYVALSRCTNLEGILLTSMFNKASVQVHERVVSFFENRPVLNSLDSLFVVERRNFLLEGLLRVFDFTLLQEEISGFFDVINAAKNIDIQKARVIFDNLNQKIIYNQETCRKFQSHITQMVSSGNVNTLVSRVEAGVLYFSNVLDAEFLAVLQIYLDDIKKTKKSKKFQRKLASLIDFISCFKNLLPKANVLAESIGTSL